MNKIGRNDPCPSGGGNKFKKCLAAYPCLGSQSSVAEIWWVCERWQAPVPDLHELRGTLTGVKEVGPSKLDAFLELALAAPSFTGDLWPWLITTFEAKRHPDLPGVFRRVSAHLSATGNSELPWFYCSAAASLREDHPEMFPEVLAATLALDPTTTLMESLEMLVAWADELGREDACQRLRERFHEFPEYMLLDPDEESPEAEHDDRREEREPDFPPEVLAAVDKAWDNFEALDPPSLEQAEAFVEELLALPHEATQWNDVFNAAAKCEHPDVFKILHRLAAALFPTRNPDFAYVCWAAVDSAQRLKTLERLPEIARTLLDFNPQSCDPDALSHIADALLAHGFVDETISFLSGFLPSLRDNEDVMSWVAPRVAGEIFLLRLGSLIVSGDYSRQPFDLLIAGLCAGVEDDISESSAGAPLRYLMQDGESFTREQFMVPSSANQPTEQKLLWDGLQQAFVEVARDGWQTENRHPSKALIGLHMIFRAVEYRLDSPKQKGEKYPLNLLDYLNPVAVERLVLRECSSMFGINCERASIMLDASVTLIRWARRQGLIDEKTGVKAEKDIIQLMAKVGF